MSAVPLQEQDHTADVASRAAAASRTTGDQGQSQPLVEDAQLPLEQKKRKIQRNLRTLEQSGLVSSANKYQDILNEIAKVRRWHPPSPARVYEASAAGSAAHLEGNGGAQLEQLQSGRWL